MDHLARSRVRPKKGARDRLIRLLASHPAWALGFEDETWWSRTAHPKMFAWTPDHQPLHLIEHTVPPDDPDPKALAAYGLLVRFADAPEQTWLRFVDGRPLSALTIPFLEWCCQKLDALGKTALLLVWDNASWHISHAVRQWPHGHNRQIKRERKGVLILPCPLRIKSPLLNPIEQRVCDALRCPLADHRCISEHVA